MALDEWDTPESIMSLNYELTKFVQTVRYPRSQRIKMGGRRAQSRVFVRFGPQWHLLCNGTMLRREEAVVSLRDR
jgi:hypothetical protein